jgi:hypothetical protein
MAKMRGVAGFETLRNGARPYPTPAALPSNCFPCRTWCRQKKPSSTKIGR